MSDSTPPTPPPYPSAPGGDPAPRSDDVSFFSALFDFGFTTFVTPKIVKVVYVVGTVLIGLGLLFFILTAFSQNVGFGLVVLLVGPVVAVVYLAFLRMILEMYFAIVRLSEDVHHGRGRF